MGIPTFVKQLYLSRPGALGQRRRVAAATYAIAGSPHTLFTIAGGNILITALYAEVVDPIATASTGQVAIDPTAGAAINMDDGTFLYTLVAGQIVLLPMDVAFPAAAALAIAAPAWPYNYIAPPGTITFSVAGANIVGTLEWTLFYIPLDPATTVV